MFGSSGTGGGGSASGFGGRDRAIDTALKPRGPLSDGPSSGAGSDLKIGDDVHHRKWGEGVILDLRGSGDKTEVVVHFPSVGEKTLLLAWAPLEKVG